MNITKLFAYQKPYTDYILATILALAFLLFALPVRAQQDPELRRSQTLEGNQKRGEK
ncbi:MAG TPA: hypothetical protein VN957_15905 [Chthoniobacterales bacterium]|nr:hypothetical protein [Chthoniobacterales bacterium]